MAVDAEAAGGEGRHRYRVCELFSREKRMGRPKRIVVLSWDDLSDEDVAHLRRLHEPKLTSLQVAELDGRIVARGSNVTQADVEDWDATAPGAPVVRTDSPVEVSEFAHRVLSDILDRDARAGEELRRQNHELNQRALEQGKKLDEMLDKLAEIRADLIRQAQPPGAAQPAAVSLNLEDVKQVIQIGATIARDVFGKGAGPKGS